MTIWSLPYVRLALAKLAAVHSFVLPLPPAQTNTRLLLEERYIATSRYISSFVTLPLIPFLPVDLFWATVVTCFAIFYNSVIAWLLIPRGSRVLNGGYFAFMLDLTSISVVISSSGGINCDYFVIYYLMQLAYSLRFPGLNSLLIPIPMAIWYSAAIFLSGGFSPETAATDLATMAFRVFWIPCIGVFTSIAVQRARRAEASLETELQRTRALLQAAHAPAASLTVDGVLNATLQQSQRLTDCDFAAVHLYRRQGQGSTFRRTLDSTPAGAAFARLVRSNSPARRLLLSATTPVLTAQLVRQSPELPVAVEELNSVCAVPIPGRRGNLGFVAVARRGPEPLTDVHYEALSAFVERAALAIQNATLYEQLQHQVEELRSLNTQIVRAERLAALGELAARVAHELNNPLTSIHLYNSLLLEQAVDAAEQKRLATTMLEQVERAKRVVRDILDYSRPAAPQIAITSVNPTVEQGLRLVRHAAAAAHVTIVEDYGGNLPLVRVDEGQMAQIFTNLTLNAIHAMPQGGSLVVSTGLEGDEIYVRFQDSGVGIPPEHRARIFEPFFTTKATGEGTGLGLAVCQSLISRHRGRITVDSEVGQGSTFTVWLPPAPDKESIVGGFVGRG